MHSQFVRILVYLAFLGTAVGAIVGEQAVNISLVVILLALVLTLVVGDGFRLPYWRMSTAIWFVLVTSPGTSLYLFRGAPALVPLAQYAGILVIWLVVWNFFRYQQYSPDRIFMLYLRCAKVAAIVGVLQQFGYLLQLEYVYDMRWLLIGAADLDPSGSFLRVYSLFTEPSYFAAFLMPASYFAILRLTGFSKLLSVGECVLFIIALLCTFSTIGYIGLVLCMLFALRLTFRDVFLSVSLVIILLMAVSSSPVISARLSLIPDILLGDLQGDENLSAIVNGLNLSIAKDMLSDQPLFGLGIGAYRVYSPDYLDSFIVGNQALITRVSEIPENLSLADGGSMYLRLPVELGIGGCLILLLLILRGRRSHVPTPHDDIATAALLFIAVFSIRSGQLVRFDFIFFCALYSLIWFQKPRVGTSHITNINPQRST